MDAERQRLAEADQGIPWRRWGPYLSERAWGTVREDYSAGGEAWDDLPHEHARSRAFRWSEDGLAGICDEDQILCLGLAVWNGRDPILKERIFGLANGRIDRGNHGEDAKEYWWYLDATPTSSWLRWRYHYPQDAFPYQRLVEENGRRGKLDPEYELLDAGVFDTGGYWQITVDYAKAGPEDLCMRVEVRNAGTDWASLEVLPTVWFRNTWSWDLDPPPKPQLWADQGVIRAEHAERGRWVLVGSGEPELLFCENESNRPLLWSQPASTAYPKDGINDHVTRAAATVNPDRRGTKAAFRYRIEVPAGGSEVLHLRMTRTGVTTVADDGAAGARPDLGAEFEAVLSSRQRQADDFYAPLTPPDVGQDEAAVMRQAFAGMLWSKQFYHYDVRRWLTGDPVSPPPPEGHQRGRNVDWQHLRSADVISMPDPWEYPWFATWDLAFHCVVLAHVDAEFAKAQLVLLTDDRFMHWNGQLPAFEWDFNAVNPPVHAWAAMRVFEIDGSRDFAFLDQVMQRLLCNLQWWTARQDADGNNLFEGGFLGLDNIGPFDRSRTLGDDARLEQADSTAWMAMYCLDLLEMAFRLSRQHPAYDLVAVEVFDQFLRIAQAMNDLGMWDEDDGFYYDLLRSRDGSVRPLRVRSMVGLVALYAVTFLKRRTLQGMPLFQERLDSYLADRPEHLSHLGPRGEDDNLLFSVVDPHRLRRILSTVLDEEQFLSPHGLRSLSRYHRDHPFGIDVPGVGQTSVGYQPAESETGDFGGNSNWRGPIWFPLNYLLIESLLRFRSYLGDEFTVELPTGSGHHHTLGEVASSLSQRLVALFIDQGGRRPVFGWVQRFQDDPAWHDLLLSFEYFHGDNGAGLGASHQTGWTGLVADLINTRGQGGPSRLL